ncbi:PAS domain-containing protein [Rhizobium sp. SG2393]|uniref:PAS domain-containing protein n=1 Tax=Rhizobium sp. SG2393 TaxID=3276279 RepID=UPI00366CD171
MTGSASPDANIHRLVLDVAADMFAAAVLVCDKSDAIVFASRSLLQIFPIPGQFIQPGTRLRDFLGAVYDCGIRPGTVPETSRRRANRDEWISRQISMHWRERHEMEERIGRNRWINIVLRRLTSGHGVFAFVDISEQRKREEQLQLDTERVEMTERILDEMPNPLFVKDRNLHYVAVNKAFCRLHGITPEQVLGRTVWDLIDPDLAERYERSDRQVLDTGEAFALPEQVVTADGEDMWVVTRKFRVGEPPNAMLVSCMNDVSEVLTSGDVPLSGPSGTVTPDYDAFQPGQNCYDPFRAIVVQDLGGAPELIEQAKLPDAASLRQRRVAVVTADSTLGGAIVAQLSIWGLEACAVTSFGELRLLLELAAGEGLSLDAVLADTALGPAGTWAVPLVPFGNDYDARALLSNLADVGVALFADVMALDSDAHLEAGAEAEGPERQPLVDVLVVEDNQINQFVFSQILEALSISQRIVATGREAIEAWRALRPRFVFVDISLPDMDAYVMVGKIRELEANTEAKTPIVMVANGIEAFDVDRAAHVGVRDHIMKPISPDAIEVIYRRYIPVKVGKEGSQH